MRKILKRMLALSLILALGLLTIPAQASQVSEEAQLGQAETVTPVVTEETEYEMHSRLISCSDAELMDAGLTEAEIEELREFSFEEAFLERAQLDRESLAALGYTEEQINVLKAYKGEPITDDSPILLASATCSGYFSYVSTGTNSLSFNYHWIWSAPPMAFFTDAVAICWQAVNSSAMVISVSGTSTGYVDYYSVYTGTFKYRQYLSLSSVSGFNGRKADFGAKEPYVDQADGTSWVWARSGRVTTTVVPDGDATINLVKAHGAIGHASLSVNVGLSFSGTGIGFSFTPSDKVSAVGSANYTIKPDGDCYSN